MIIFSQGSSATYMVKGPGTIGAERHRVTLAARHCIHNWWDPAQTPRGEIEKNILVVYGKHCRLETIGEDGTWLQSDRFRDTDGKWVVRRKGDKVPPQLMGTWRAVRQQAPHLLDSLLIWQQPSACFDTVLWRWQQELTVKDHGGQAVIISDALPCSWSEQSRQSAWLLNLVQAPVGSGMTPLQQPTDTHMAKPAKDCDSIN